MAVNLSYANPNNEYLGGGGPWLTPKQLFLTNGPVNSQLIKLPEFQAASRQGKKKNDCAAIAQCSRRKDF